MKQPYWKPLRSYKELSPIITDREISGILNYKTLKIAMRSRFS